MAYDFYENQPFIRGFRMVILKENITDSFRFQFIERFARRVKWHRKSDQHSVTLYNEKFYIANSLTDAVDDAIVNNQTLAEDML